MDEIKEVEQHQGGHSQLRRDAESLDDFEHLSPQDASPGARATHEDAFGHSDDPFASFDPLKQPPQHLLEMGDQAVKRGLQEATTGLQEASVDVRSATLDFMERERNPVFDAPLPKHDLLERFSDSEPEEDVIKPKTSIPETFKDFKDVEEFIGSQGLGGSQGFVGSQGFGGNQGFAGNQGFVETDVQVHPQPAKTEDLFTINDFPRETTSSIKQDLESKKVDDIQDFLRESSRVEDVKATVGDTKVLGDVEVVKKEQKEEPVVCRKAEEKETKKSSVIDAEAIFCKMGLDTWFNPERLDPKVESLIYWRDPKKSGPVFGGVLLVLLALTYFSLISVVAYLSLLSLAGTLSYRIYKNIVQAVQKTGDGHPFKDLLELDVSLPQDKVKQVSEVAVAHINAAVIEIRRLFLVEDLVDSIKFGVLLWTLTYLGAWFNGMTLIIIAWVALFTLPKVYETNKTQIDANLEVVRTKLAEITSKVKAAIPIGKKAEEKKEQ